MFICPGCAAGGPEKYAGLHELPVNATGIAPVSWDWDGNLEAPTLSPSLLSRGHCLCHSFLRQGVFEFLPDSDHPLSGQKVPMPDLPQWAIDMHQASDNEEQT